MKSISHKTLLRKSRDVRNKQAIQHLADMDSLREWGNTPVEQNIPEYKEVKIDKKKMAWGLLMAIHKSVSQLKP